MSMPSIRPERTVRRALTWAGRYTGGVVLLVLTVVGVAISPMVITAIRWGDPDWARLSVIGEAYGPVSALLSALALCFVVLVQRAQVRHERTWFVRDMHMSVMQIALDDPTYGQCWGPRMSPDKIDERHFYYTNMIIMLWFYAWENGELRDGQVLAYARGMFDSEIPRAYWRRYGSWRLAGARGTHRHYLSLLDAAFRRAEDEGPPSRRLERSAAGRRDGPRRLGYGRQRSLSEGRRLRKSRQSSGVKQR